MLRTLCWVLVLFFLKRLNKYKTTNYFRHRYKTTLAILMITSFKEV